MTENHDPRVGSLSAPAGNTPGEPRIVAQRYALLDELGRGGMGTVWRGEDRTIGRKVAVKELRGPDDPDEAGVFQERVLREVRTGGRINDPAVVTVYDVVTEGLATYIVMELVEAPTLSELVAEQGALPPSRVAALGQQVLSALQAAHQAGIVHRDVKPGNIMVGANGRVKLTDFGIAQAVDDPRLTTSGNLVGSPAFMAPERVAGSEAVPASDLWSLGAALYFAVEGIVAFERTSTAATLHAIMNEMPYLTRTQGPLASAIMGLLTADPDARMPAGQAYELLGAATQQGQPTPQPSAVAAGTAHLMGQPTAVVNRQPGASASGAPGRPAPAKRGWLLAGTAVLGVALLVGGFFLGRWIYLPETDQQQARTLTYGSDGDISVFAERSGYSSYNCVDSAVEPDARITGDSWIDCEQLHVAELYAVGEIYGGSDNDDAEPAEYPAPEELRATAQQHCGLTFHSNVIDDSLRNELRYRALVPSRSEWRQQPESSSESVTRDYYCLVSRADNSPLKQSVRNEVS